MSEESIKGNGREHSRRLEAIMFTDIKGFASLMEKDESAAVDLVKKQREIVRKFVSIHKGEERETIGDAFLVIFPSVLFAVQCAIDIQRELSELNKGLNLEKQIWLRIGIHLGDIIIEEGSVFGEGVNIAARVEPLAEPGGICITRQVYDQVKHCVDLKFRKLGVKELKNIKDVPELYHIVSGTLPGSQNIELPGFAEKIISFFSSPARIFLATLIFLFVVGMILYFYFFAGHTLYSRQIIYNKHVPEPKFEISGGEAGVLNKHFKLTFKGKKVVRLEEVRRQESFADKDPILWEDLNLDESKRDFPIHEYLYEGGRVKEERVSDKYGIFQYKLVFSKDGSSSNAQDENGFTNTFENQISGFGYSFDKDGRLVVLENRNPFGVPRDDSRGVARYKYSYNEEELPSQVSSFDSYWNAVEDKEGVASINYSYNSIGLAERKSFLDRYGSLTSSVDGYAITAYEYDDNGRLISERYFDQAKQPIMNNEGSCARSFLYDDEGRLIEERSLDCTLKLSSAKKGYAVLRFGYENDLAVSKTFLDEKGNPVVNSRQGVSSIKMGYNDSGRIVDLSFFDAKGREVLDNWGIHAVRYNYNERGNLSSRLFVGLDDKPAISAAGYAEVAVSYDERGRASQLEYYGKEGYLINRRDGYAIMRSLYDQFGNKVQIEFFDKEKLPAFGRQNNCHLVQMKYDNDGNLSEGRCFDNKGSLTPDRNNCAISRYENNNLGKLTRFECYIAEGKLVDLPDIPSVLTVQYDERGYTKEVRAYNSSEKLAERYHGAAIWKRVSDEFGNPLEIATYDRNGSLITNPKYNGAIFRREFDNKGNVLRMQVFDINNRPAAGVWGVSEISYRYDENGEKISEVHFDAQGKPTVNKQGVHEYRSAYDEKRRLVTLSSFGPDGKLAEDNSGVALTQNKYDDLGRLSERSYFDAGNNPVVSKSQRSFMQRFRYDESGNMIEISKFGSDENLCRLKDCIAIIEQFFDSKGLITKKIFKDADKKRTVNERDAGGYEYKYDPEGRGTVEYVLDTKDSRAKDNYGIYEYHMFYKPHMSNAVWFFTFFGGDGGAIRSNKGADLRLVVYDAVYRERETARVDVTMDGRVIEQECFDDVGNVIKNSTCVRTSEIVDELKMVREFLEANSIL